MKRDAWISRKGMATKPGIEVGDRILVEHTVTAVSENGTVTYEVTGTPVTGTPITIRAAVRLEEDGILHVIKATQIRDRRAF
jgi:hypothetical protein